MQQQRNLLLFFVLSLGLLLGWMYVQQKIWPPQQPAPGDQTKDAKLASAAAAATASTGGTSSGLPGLFLAVALAQALDPTASKDKEKPKENDEIALPTGMGATPDKELIALGSEARDSEFHLRALLDPRGASVRAVLLNKFQEADSEGRPVWKPEEKKVPAPLRLVPGSANLREPSHLLMLYDAADPRNDRPLDTLGRALWKVVKTGGKAIVTDEVDRYGAGRKRQSVTFQAQSQGAVITKTFSLVEGEYHLGLEVKIQRKKTNTHEDKRERKYAYQLTGAHGLPVEGKWYTSIFRNAMIAQVDGRGKIYDRDLQELREISLRNGGNPVEKARDYFIRYAGVAVQYFASMIVVDNEQPEGGTQAFLRRARPTLERAVIHGRVENPPVLGPRANRDRPKDTDIATAFVMVNEDGTKETFYILEGNRDQLKNLKKGDRIALIYHTGSYDPKLKEFPRIVEEIRVGDAADATQALWEDDITVRVTTEPVELEAGGKPLVHRYLLYNGPVKVSQLRERASAGTVAPALVDRYHDELCLKTMTDSPSPGRVGDFAGAIGWSYLLIKCTNLMHWILGGLHSVISSYGLCIVLLTVLVRGLMFPLSRKQALMGLKMQELGPEIKKLKEKHKDDNQAFAAAQMELFRKHGVNPMGTCWVLLLQMPIFMGLYYALQESILFRLAPFWPTWITNLAAPDMMIPWGDRIPWISRPQDFGGFIYLGPYFNLLPVIAVGLMIVQQKMMTPPPADEQQAMQQKMMKYMMIFFGLFFYKVAAGLCIYFIASSMWGFAERKLLPKSQPRQDDPTKAVLGQPRPLGSEAGAASSSAITTAGGVTTDRSRNKPGRAKRREREQRGREAAPAKPDDQGVLQRLRDWWGDVLEKARKK